MWQQTSELLYAIRGFDCHGRISFNRRIIDWLQFSEQLLHIDRAILQVVNIPDD